MQSAGPFTAYAVQAYRNAKRHRAAAEEFQRRAALARHDADRAHARAIELREHLLRRTKTDRRGDGPAEA